MKYNKLLLQIIYPFVLFSRDWIDDISNQLSGEIYLLRKEIETPLTHSSFYDQHFRKWDYHLRKDELEFDLNIFKYKNKENFTNWSFLIPIDNQAEMHYVEAETLWNQNKKLEAIYLWKALRYVKINKKIANASSKKIEEISRNQIYFDYLRRIEPYFLYDSQNNQTIVLSDEIDLKIKLFGYWSHIFTKKNEWFYFIYFNNDYRTFFLKSGDNILYFHVFYKTFRDDVLRAIQYVDNLYSWNENLKKEVNFIRERIKSNVFKVSYFSRNQFTKYREIYFLHEKNLYYIRLYNLQNNDLEMDRLNF